MEQGDLFAENERRTLSCFCGGREEEEHASVVCSHPAGGLPNFCPAQPPNATSACSAVAAYCLATLQSHIEQHGQVPPSHFDSSCLVTRDPISLAFEYLFPAVDSVCIGACCLSAILVVLFRLQFMGHNGQVSWPVATLVKCGSEVLDSATVGVTGVDW